MGSSAWYADPNALLEQVRLAGSGRGVAPSIPGYDDLIEIRRGGQGVVFSATQRSTRRRVAIKLLLDGAFASSTARRRFEREIELVAGLHHPHIVQIYDSGITADDRPYFVMEYIEGEPLDRFLRAGEDPGHAAGTSADSQEQVKRVLHLFLPISAAVQYGHQRGVIHRDLKPGNIRVDSEGSPHVLDFGLARGLQREPISGSSAPHDLTVSGQFMGSLPWASPEHAAGEPDSIDTRSDVYSLGVMLYHALAGRFPYSVDVPLRDVLDNIAQAEPASLAGSVPGVDADVDTIVSKCLAKVPERRYSSAGALADDLRRYLAGEPIEARRDSGWYTLRKTIRRYRFAALAGAVVAVAVLAALVVSLGQRRLAMEASRRADAERAVAESQRNVAEQKTRQAQAVNDFLVSMLAAADPTEKKGRDVRVADLLDQAGQDAATQFANEPATELAVRSAIGRSYLMLGLYDEAADQLTAALSAADRPAGRDSPERIEALQRLGEVRHRQGRFDVAESILRDALAERRRILGDHDALTHSTLLKLAILLSDAGNLQGAQELAREALESGRTHLGPEHRQTLAAMNLLAICHMRRGKLEEAEKLFDETLALRRRVLGEDHTETITTKSDLANVLWQRGQKDRADEMLAEIYAYARREFGEEHPRTLVAMVNLGHSRMGLKRIDEALELFQKGLEAQRRILGDDHVEVVNTSAALATALRAAGRFEEAEPIYRQVVEAAPRVLGEDHPDTLIYTNNYAAFLMSQKRPAEAEPVYQLVYESAQRKMGAEHWMTAAFRGNLGQSLMLQNRHADAEPHLLAAYEGLKSSLGADHPRTQSAASDLVRLYDEWGKPDEAEKYRANTPAAE